MFDSPFVVGGTLIRPVSHTPSHINRRAIPADRSSEAFLRHDHDTTPRSVSFAMSVPTFRSASARIPPEDDRGVPALPRYDPSRSTRSRSDPLGSMSRGSLARPFGISPGGRRTVRSPRGAPRKDPSSTDPGNSRWAWRDDGWAARFPAGSIPGQPVVARTARRLAGPTGVSRAGNERRRSFDRLLSWPGRRAHGRTWRGIAGPMSLNQYVPCARNFRFHGCPRPRRNGIGSTSIRSIRIRGRSCLPASRRGCRRWPPR